MKNKKINFKNGIKEFFVEISASFILVLLFLVLTIIGLVILSFLPIKIWNNFPGESIAIIGFLALLAILHLIDKTIEIVKKLKSKDSSTNENSATNNQEENK